MSGSQATPRKAVFLDRDGTLNVDLHYISDPHLIELYKGVITGLRLLSESHFLLVVITNQSGVSRGYYTREDVERLHEHLRERLAREGVRMDGFYYCPHAPADACPCRKPGTELFTRAAAELSIDLSSSAMIGNSKADMEAAKRAGVLGVYVRSPGFHLDPGENVGAVAGTVAGSFLEACRAVVAHS